MMSFFGNSDLVVTLTTLLFIALLVYLGVPKKIGGLLDARADKIKAELEEARRLREEAQTLLASYEKKQKEVEGQAEQIVANAKAEAEKAAEKAKEDLKASIARRLKAADDQIASAEASAVKEVRDRAIAVATQVSVGTITSSPGPMPSPRRAISSAALPLEQLTAWEACRNSAQADSNSLAFGPRAIQPLSRTSRMAMCASPFAPPPPRANPILCMGLFSPPEGSSLY